MNKLMILALLFLPFVGHATEKLDWAKCAKEMKDFSCKGDDKAIWTCLEAHDDKLSAACQETHAAADKKFKK